MKKLLLFVLMALPCVAFAQGVFVDGTVWNQRIYPDDPRESDVNVRCEIIGDTIIDGVEAMKVYEVYKGVSRLVAVIRADGDKVYALSYKGTNEWRLAYDFSMKEGDVCEVSWFDSYSQSNSPDITYYIKCISISPSEEYGGWPMMHFEMYDSAEFSAEYFFGEGDWLVGIGNVAGVAWNTFTDEMMGGGGRVLSVEKDGETVCQYTVDGIGDAAAKAMSVSVYGKNVTVKGADAGCAVRAYALSGALAASAVASADGSATLTLPASGLYHIATPGGAVKAPAR